jgi:tetratricopeptide (TPR) repeat protein
MEINIDIRTLYEFNGMAIPEEKPPLPEIEKMIREQFSFLPQPVKVKINGWKGTITYSKESPESQKEAERLQKKATQRAAQGKYDKVVGILKRVLELSPTNFQAKRDLAMVFFEQGNSEESKNQLIEILGVQSDDVWSLVILANLYSKYEKNFEVAERIINRAIEIKPDDPWAINSLGAVLMEQKKFSDAEKLFKKSISLNPSFVNPYMGKAMTEGMQGKTEDAKKTLEDLFTIAKAQDSRSIPVFDQARNLYRETMKELAQKNIQSMWNVIEEIKKELSDISGYPVRIEAGNPPGETLAIIQMAWKYGRDYHLIIYKENVPDEILIHLVSHELEHLRLECAARKTEKNRFLVVTSKNKEKAISNMKEDAERLMRQGFSEKSINGLTLQLAEGIVRQVQNGPIDLLIEKNLYKNYPLLRPAQFVSLAILTAQAKESVTIPKIRDQMPDHIVFASSALNGATALFLDKLWKGATCYAKPYRNLDSFTVSQELLSILEDRIETMKPGEEYEIVDVWAEKLGLQDWYQWQEDTGPYKELEKTKYEAETDPELLKKKHPVAVWYFLDALERFDGMTEEEIRKVSFEIGMLGRTGLDYSSPDEKYTLRNIPGKKFSGLHLMCLMYTGFKRIAPDQDLGIDLEEPYSAAIKLHNKKENN